MNMPGWNWKDAQRRWPLVLLACLAIGATLSVHMGQDASWDLRNYHLYNAWAWLNGREQVDVAAASLQSFFNPVLDVPYYLLMAGPLEHAPGWLAAVQGLWYGLLVFFVYRITMTMAHLQDRTPGLADWLAIVMGATGTMAVSQAGLTSNEVPVACLVLASIACVLHGLPCSRSKSPLSWLLAGLLAGLAAGLKPSAIVYPLAAGFAALLALRPRRLAARTFLVLASGSALGFLLSYGAWAWHLYQATGNPVFPMFNQVFHSPWGPPGSMTDRRFMPRDAGQWLAYPFYWLRRTQSVVTEVRFADPRYALSFLAVLALALTAPRRRAQGTTPASLALAWLSAFWMLAYLGWLLLFSILRYAIPLEALSGVLVLHVARRLWPATEAQAVRGVLGISLLACLSLTHYPDWGHVPFSRQTLELDAPKLPDHSLVLLVGMPVAYLAPFLPQGTDVHYAGVNWLVGASRGRRLYDEVADRAQRHRGPLYALYSSDVTAADRALLLQLLPDRRDRHCHPVRSSLERDRRGRPRANTAQLCELLDSATTGD
jgi:hypothetical protein